MTRSYFPGRYSGPYPTLPGRTDGETDGYWTRRIVFASDQCFSSE